jgi:hypothetical protein
MNAYVKSSPSRLGPGRVADRVPSASGDSHWICSGVTANGLLMLES